MEKKWSEEVHAGLMAAHTLRTCRVGLHFPREPLACELKTEVPKLHYNTMETMDTVEITFLEGLNLLCAVRLE